MSIDLFSLIRDLGLPPPQGVLQVGASYGQELAHFLANGVRCGVLIEPLPEPFQHIAATCRQLPGFVAVQAVCAETDGQTCTFHIASNHGMSSSLLRPARHLDQFADVHFERSIELVTHRLDHVVGFLEENGHAAVTSGLDTLYMDTQGAELRILSGAPGVLARISYIFTEVTRNEMYEGAPTLRGLMDFLDTAGFTLNNVYFNQHQHGDALFIRKSLLGVLS